MAKRQKKDIGKVKKAHIKQPSRNEIRTQKAQAAKERQALRDKRTNKEQLALLNSKGWKAEKERDRLNVTS